MKHLLLTAVCCVLIGSASADHSDNGKCIDEIKHWNGLNEAQKSQADAKAKMDEGAAHWAQGNKSECEAAVKSAITLATD